MPDPNPTANSGGRERRKKLNRFLSKIIVAVGLVTYSLLAPVGADAAALIRPGDSGPEVAFIQKRLRNFGYDISSADGIYGSVTVAAVYEFQANNGLEADGIIGPQTMQALRSGSQASRGQRSRYLVDNIIQTSKRFQGVPYLWGGDTPQGFDCSGFTQYVFRLNGIKLPRTADAQYQIGISVSYDNLQPGDMVFFSTYAPGPSHNGIYIGNGLFINSSSSLGVSIARMDNPYWAARYIGAKRIIR